MATTTTVEKQESSGEAKLKEQKDDNGHHRMVLDSSSPSTSFNPDQLQKDPIIITDKIAQVKHTSSTKSQSEELESTKAEMGEVIEENQKLKQSLSQILKDFQKLQKKYHEISEQDLKQLKDDSNDDDEAKLVSLSLGRTSSLDSNKAGNIKLSLNATCSVNRYTSDDDQVNDEKAMKRNLDLGLECKTSGMTIDHQQTLVRNLSPDNSFDETKDGEGGGGGGGETWPASKVLKNNSGDDEVVQQPPSKKARVSVRVRCDTPTMNDGCQWRKYGQKIAKGNPCPRAYYRCTVAPSCPVRKQVQRCAEDMSILITTYEGTHNHPLPVTATSMASTTSAAAHMLMSKSSTSSTSGSHQSMFNILNDSKPKPIYVPNSFTYSSIATHPTITLDLISTTSNFGSSYPSPNLTLNFADNSTNNPLLLSWPNALPTYGSQSYINKNHIASSTQQTPQIPSNNHQSLPDTVAQAAKVLTSDPSFQSILTATLSSFISGNNSNVNSGNVGNNVINSIGLEDNMK